MTYLYMDHRAPRFSGYTLFVDGFFYIHTGLPFQTQRSKDASYLDSEQDFYQTSSPLPFQPSPLAFFSYLLAHSSR